MAVHMNERSALPAVFTTGRRQWLHGAARIVEAARHPATGMVFAWVLLSLHPSTTAKGSDMDSIKARITGDGIDTSVEFSVEEVIAKQQGKSWGEMDEAQQRQAMKDYAIGLVSRQDGVGGDLKATLEGGTFSEVSGKDI
jgi:hypothetical protein